MAKTFGDDCDWRGTKIEVGQTVIYGAPVGRSIAMVQGVVDGFTPSGRVWIKVVHRAYGGWAHADSKSRVHVGNDRLTVIDSLPATTLPTEGDKKADAIAEKAKRDAHEATHTMRPYPERVDSRNYIVDYDRYQKSLDEFRKDACSVCHCSWTETWTKDCVSP